MNRYLFIIRGPISGGISQEETTYEQEVLQIREWLKGIKSEYQEMLYQKLGSNHLTLGASGEIQNLLKTQLDGGEIIQLFTIILPDWENAEKIAKTFPFPSEFYTIEVRDVL